jgi:hypothetical protein
MVSLRNRQDRPTLGLAAWPAQRMYGRNDLSAGRHRTKGAAGAKCAVSGGVKDPEAVGFRRIAIYDLDWRPSPLPDADAGDAGDWICPRGPSTATLGQDSVPSERR